MITLVAQRNIDHNCAHFFYQRVIFIDSRVIFLVICASSVLSQLKIHDHTGGTTQHFSSESQVDLTINAELNEN